jgi:hypothetical protein
LAQRGIDVSYETVRRWSVKFGLAYARKLNRSHPRADTRWHLDEVFVSINGKSMYLVCVRSAPPYAVSHGPWAKQLAFSWFTAWWQSHGYRLHPD